jgi:response regulator RpfG family c-di-GMP phosphodiesterase
MARPSLADRLLAAKLITVEHHAAGMARQRTSGNPFEDILLESGAIGEEALLRFLAAEFGCQYLSTEKLRNANLPKQLVDMVPVKVADATTTMPIRWDQRSRILAVITVDPENLDALGQVRAASGARDVQAVLARAATVRGMIAKWYHGDPRQLDKVREVPSVSVPNPEPDHVLETSEWLVQTTAPGSSIAPPPPGTRQTWSVREPAREVPAPQVQTPRPGPSVAPTPPGEAPPVPAADFIETLNVVISLLDNSRAELRGHSSVTARHARSLAERLGLAPLEVHAAVLAAQLHDLGKGSPFHLTALNVAEWEGHRDSARKRYDAPLRLLEGVTLRPETSRALLHMYERFDGQGIPAGLRGKEIPLGARILAIVDTYADLSQNARNPFRRTLGPVEAIAVFDRYRDKVFDGDLVDLFRLVVAGSDLRQKLLTGYRPILVVDADPEQSAALELRLLGRGFDVKAARTADAALRLLEEAEINIVVSEVDLEPFDGFELLRRAHAAERTRAIPFLFLTSRSAAEDVARAFELGAADYVVKPSTTEVLVAKIRQTLDRRPAAGPTAGVKGALSDMSLPDLVQILAQGRKTGKLAIRGKDGRNGEIHFLEGRVANALFAGRQGEEAFYGMLSIQEGEFALDPDFKPPAVVMEGSAESLLLEGMRRLDEAGR